MRRIVLQQEWHTWPLHSHVIVFLYRVRLDPAVRDTLLSTRNGLGKAPAVPIPQLTVLFKQWAQNGSGRNRSDMCLRRVKPVRTCHQNRGDRSRTIFLDYPFQLRQQDPATHDLAASLGARLRV